MNDDKLDLFLRSIGSAFVTLCILALVSAIVSLFIRIPSLLIPLAVFLILTVVWYTIFSWTQKEEEDTSA